MNREKYIQFIASFLIVLVLTIPFYVTSVHAALNSIGVKGSDNINNYIRANDFLTFNAQASIANDTSITANQVQLGSGLQFNTCTAAGNATDCTLRFPAAGNDSFELKSAPFTIRLFRDDSSLDDEKSGILTVDHLAPQVTLSTPQAIFTSLQNVIVNYAVTDTACNDPTCVGKCSGLKNIELYTADRSFTQVVALTGNESINCSQSSRINISPSLFNNGLNSVFAKATDKLNQVSPETSVTFTIDAIGPSILQPSFAIIRKGISLNAFPSLGIDADVVVNISEQNLNFSSVRANLLALNPSQNLRNVIGTCALTATPNIISCRWPITLNPGAPGLKSVIINASDVQGNKESVTITKQLSLDNNGPVVQSFSTPNMLNGQLVANSGSTTVTADFTEMTGIAADEMFLRFGSSRAAATECSRQGTAWSCTWQNLNLGTLGTTQISIESDSSDVLLNPVLDAATADVILDAQVPVLRSINITNVGGTTEAFAGFFKIGDKIAVVANITEANDVFATADFSPFVSGASRVAGSCERLQADEHICTWLTPPITLEANNIIRFNFTDSAGNILTVTRSLKTFGVEGAASPDFWSNTVFCSPASIDRELGTLINQRVYCQVALSPKSASQPVSTVFIGPASCTGSSSILQSAETSNTNPGSTTPIIKLTLKKDEFKLNNAELSCSFNIFTKVGSSSSITANPESETAKISLAFFNLPLGEMSNEVKEKIDDAKEEAEGIWELISTLNKIMFYAKRICQFINIFYNVVAILYTIAYTLNILDAATDKTPAFLANFITIKPAAISACGTQTTTRVVAQETHTTFVNKFCALVNCKEAVLWGKPVQDFINTDFGLGFEAQKYLNRPLSEYMKPQNNLVVATLFACLPGVIYGLDKYRQIKCLYADCLQNAVGKDGLPVTACEDQKAYATCKYVTGELFAVFPWTAVFDHFMSLIKNTLSNPFAILGAGLSIACIKVCSIPEGASRTAAWTACEFVRFSTQIGSVAQDVKNIIDEGFTIRTDYCARLESNEKSSSAFGSSKK